MRGGRTAGRAHPPNALAGLNSVAAAHINGMQMRETRAVAVSMIDFDRATITGAPARVNDAPRRRRHDRRIAIGGEVRSGVEGEAPGERVDAPPIRRGAAIGSINRPPSALRGTIRRPAARCAFWSTVGC